MKHENLIKKSMISSVVVLSLLPFGANIALASTITSQSSSTLSVNQVSLNDLIKQATQQGVIVKTSGSANNTITTYRVSADMLYRLEQAINHNRFRTIYSLLSLYSN